MASKRIKVLICDDSAVVRALLQEIIRVDTDLEVVGTAVDPHQAREMIKLLNPDVLTLDVEMPRMDGLEFLARLMRLRPMAVLMISAHTARGSETTLKALALGAVDFIAKPKAENVRTLLDYGHEIREKIRATYRARHSTPATVRDPEPAAAVTLDTRAISENVICVGASTGGTEAIHEVLARLPARCPPVLIVQHMPEMFTQSFARRLRGARSFPSAHHHSRRQLLLRPVTGAAGQPASPVGGRVVSECRRRGRPTRTWRAADRHGQGRRRGPAGDAQGRCVDRRPG